MTIRPFNVHIPDAVLSDLRSRIERTRWPDEIAGSGWAFGTNLSYMKALARYWATQFDWRTTENAINALPNFIAQLGGYDTHFLHISGEKKNSPPLLLLHGWPGSFLELMKLIPLLTRDAEPTFDLVIPSLPGYGFSQAATTPGAGVRFMAQQFAALMEALGYQKFGIHGGDFGSGVGTAMALAHPERVVGLHINNIEGYYKPFVPEGSNLTPEEIASLKEGDGWYDREGAYLHQQKTKPLTLSYGLNDSPVGLCAWIVEKFQSWSDCGGDVERVFTKDELLSNVTLYWVTGTTHSSFRIYYESRKTPLHFIKEQFVTVPVGIAHFPLEAPFPPRRYIERGYNVQHWTEFPAGGHFAAMEQPARLAEDIREFFGAIWDI